MKKKIHIYVDFKDFVAFLKKHNAYKKFFYYASKKGYTAKVFFVKYKDRSPVDWIDSVFMFANTKEPDFWYILAERWQETLYFCEDTEYTGSMNTGDIEEAFRDAETINLYGKRYNNAIFCCTTEVLNNCLILSDEPDERGFITVWSPTLKTMIITRFNPNNIVKDGSMLD